MIRIIISILGILIYTTSFSQDTLVYKVSGKFKKESYILFTKKKTFVHTRFTDAINVTVGSGNYRINNNTIYFFFNNNIAKKTIVKLYYEKNKKFIKLNIYDDSDDRNNKVYPVIKVNDSLVSIKKWEGYYIDKSKIHLDSLSIEYKIDGKSNNIKIKYDKNLAEVKIIENDIFATKKYESNFVKKCYIDKKGIICNSYFPNSVCEMRKEYFIYSNSRANFSRGNSKKEEKKQLK